MTSRRIWNNNYLNNLTKLKHLILCYNKLNDNISDYSFTNLQNLEIIDFRNNRLYGNIPEDIGSLNKLKKINLSKNNFSGIITSKIFTLPKLKVIGLDDHNFNNKIDHIITDW